MVRSFKQAEKYIFVDEEKLKQSIGFLLEQQMENGAFAEKGEVHHKDMQVGGGFWSKDDGFVEFRTGMGSKEIRDACKSANYAVMDDKKLEGQLCRRALRDFRIYF